MVYNLWTRWRGQYLQKYPLHLQGVPTVNGAQPSWEKGRALQPSGNFTEIISGQTMELGSVISESQCRLGDRRGQPKQAIGLALVIRESQCYLGDRRGQPG